jgi:hypothetical protein
LTISGAHTSPGAGDNAAAIRDHENGGANANQLLVENSTIENSQNGILTAGSGNRENVTIKGTTFLNDGSGNGATHALYVGDAASLDVENSTFCGTNNGHDVKSRAATTTVAGSTLYIGATGPGCASAGSTGFGVDAPNGGVLKLVNDSLIQGPANSNGAMVSYGEEGVLFATNSLTADSSFVSTANGLAIQELSVCPLQAGAPTRVLQPFIDRIVKLIYRFGLITELELYLFANELRKLSIAWWKSRTSENFTLNKNVLI